MRLFLNPLFVVSATLFWANQGLEKLGIFLPYVHAYLDDIVALPITLTIALWVQRTWVFRNPGYVLNWKHIAFTVIYFGLVFEWLLPKWSTVHHADPFDLIAYSVGGVLFSFFGQEKNLIQGFPAKVS
ncbi:MAG: hypothetical protein ACFB10_00560 [Salibacteraceae bacterium]